VQAYQRIIEYGRAAENFVSEILGIAGLIQLTLNHGSIRFAFEIATQGIDRVERSGLLHPISAAVYGALGQVHYEWNQLEQAHPYYLRACQVSNLSGYSDAEIGYDVILSRLYLTEGNLEASAREFGKAVDLMRAIPPAWVREEVAAQQVRLYLAQGRPAEAEAALKGLGFCSGDDFAIPPLAPGQTVGYSAGQLYLSALRLLLYRAQAGRDPARVGPAIELADRVVDGALQGRYLTVALEALLLRAEMHALRRDDGARLADYAKALELAAPEGFVRIFVENEGQVAEALEALLKGPLPEGVSPAYVRDILGAISTVHPAGRSGLLAQGPRAAIGDANAAIEPLTERELEVLRLMAEGLTYEEVAGRLVVSVNTVRFHVKGLYGKLGVAKRIAAVERARALGLLDSGA
jgi:LuxR family maltose regulon positive regulatory protein